MPALAPLLGCGASADAPTGPLVTFDACAPLVLVPDASATDAQLAGLTAAVALWNGTAATQLQVGTAPPAGASTVPLHFQPAAAPMHGLYDPHAVAIFINDDLSDLASPLAVTIAHEVGHAFGLVHIPEGTRASVMNPGNLSTTPNAGDVAALADLWGTCAAPQPPPAQ
jgi:hypothetical protein